MRLLRAVCITCLLAVALVSCGADGDPIRPTAEDND